jgi:hypothetical protein
MAFLNPFTGELIASDPTKASKTYVDDKIAVIQAELDATVYYHELHVNFDYVGASSDGSPYKPFKTIQSAVNAAQLLTIGGNTAILVHLKKNITVTENVVINNAVSNLYISAAVSNNIDASTIIINGSLTITGSQTNRVRIKDITFKPASGYALIIDGTNGRHMFQNCQFTNGSIAGLAGTGVNLTNTYKNFLEFIDCTIEGTMNIAGTPSAGTSISMYRCRMGYSTLIVNSANVAVAVFDTYGIYGVTHTAGALGITGMWGFGSTGFFNSTAALSATNFLSLSEVSLQKLDLSFIALNKTGTCYYQLMNVHRGESSDVLSGTRTVYGPTATDAGYKMGVSGNWSSPVYNVGGALDLLASSKISTSQKGAANGVAPLNSVSKIDSTYLPSYVDDVVEYASLAVFPVTGETGKIYVALDTNKTYRWSGSTYVEISPAPVISVNTKIGAVVLDKSDIGLSNADNTSDLLKPISTATQTALNAKENSANKSIDGALTSNSDTLFPTQKAVKTYVDGTISTQNQITKEPTGFANLTDSTMSFVDGTRIFTIAPTSTSFDFYVKGTKFTKSSAQTVTVPNLSGTHYIYFNSSGVLSTTQVADVLLFTDNAIVSNIYWNTDTSSHIYFAEERHGLVMDGATHAYLHRAFGARYLAGLALQGFTIGNGSLDSHAQFTADSGTISDEDLVINCPAQTQMPILFQQGQLWRKKTADNFPLVYSGTAGYVGANGRAPYNQYTGGAWQLTQVSNNDYFLVHFFATNDKENPIVGIQGVNVYVNIPQARTGAAVEISSLTGLPFAEFVAVGSVIFQTQGYANTPQARIVLTDTGAYYVDVRGTQVYSPFGQVTDHGLLSGLSHDDHLQYHTDARGDVRYYTKAQSDTSLASKENTITAGTTSQYWRGDKSWQTLDKSAIGLGNVENYTIGAGDGLSYNSGILAVKIQKEVKTLIAGDVTSQYIDLAYEAIADSVSLIPVGGISQESGVDFNLSVVSGKTRISFSGDLATGGSAALIAGDKLIISYFVK